MRHLSLVLIGGILFALGCGGDDNPSGPSDGAGNTVTVGTPAGGLVFNPASISVPVNSTVTWNWNSGGVAHDVTFPDGSGSESQTSGSFQKQFPTAGTFRYICSIHRAAMSGTVNVTASTGQQGGTGGSGTGGGGGGGAYP